MSAAATPTKQPTTTTRSSNPFTTCYTAFQKCTAKAEAEIPLDMAKFEAAAARYGADLKVAFQSAERDAGPAAIEAGKVLQGAANDMKTLNEFFQAVATLIPIPQVVAVATVAEEVGSILGLALVTAAQISNRFGIFIEKQTAGGAAPALAAATAPAAALTTVTQPVVPAVTNLLTVLDNLVAQGKADAQLVAQVKYAFINAINTFEAAPKTLAQAQAYANLSQLALTVAPGVKPNVANQNPSLVHS